MKYRCIEPFAVDCYDDRGIPTEGRVEIVCGSIWERDDETDIIGAGAVGETDYLLPARRQGHAMGYPQGPG